MLPFEWNLPYLTMPPLPNTTDFYCLLCIFFSPWYSSASHVLGIYFLNYFQPSLLEISSMRQALFILFTIVPQQMKHWFYTVNTQYKTICWMSMLEQGEGHFNPLITGNPKWNLITSHIAVAFSLNTIKYPYGTESQGNYCWLISCLLSCDFDSNTIEVGNFITQDSSG